MGKLRLLSDWSDILAVEGGINLTIKPFPVDRVIPCGRCIRTALAVGDRNKDSHPCCVSVVCRSQVHSNIWGWEVQT